MLITGKIRSPECELRFLSRSTSPQSGFDSRRSLLSAVFPRNRRAFHHMLRWQPLKFLIPMLGLSLLAFILLIRCSEFPLIAYSLPIPTRVLHPFSDVASAFGEWDRAVGCDRFHEKHGKWTANASAVQEIDGGDCSGLDLQHVSILIEKWTWIPDNLDQIYSCRCGLSCLWTKSRVLADNPDALLFENFSPPRLRRKGDPLRVYIDLEPSRMRSGSEDIFIGYHAKDDLQSTYAGAQFHNSRNYRISPTKRNDTLVYWSSSRCLPHRDELAHSFLSLVSHHSFGKCWNNVGGADMALSFYPECTYRDAATRWYDHLHCSMSHYKFVLAIENTMKESYVTEKLFYALDAGSVPIYFGAPNVIDFVPPNSIIDGTKFKSIAELAAYVERVGNDPVAYAEFHAWRRCGVMGNYHRVRAASLDTLPCRLCEAVSRRGGRLASGL